MPDPTDAYEEAAHRLMVRVPTRIAQALEKALLAEKRANKLLGELEGVVGSAGMLNTAIDQLKEELFTISSMTRAILRWMGAEDVFERFDERGRKTGSEDVAGGGDVG